MAEAIYGAKPGKHTAMLSGIGLGGTLGGAGGIAAGGYRQGSRYLRKNRAKVKALTEQGKSGEAAGLSLAGIPMSVLHGLQGGVIGGAYGIPAGSLAGGVLGKLVDKKRMARYLAKRKKVNIALGSGAGLTGLAALALKKGKD
jgi:hypothetical protein